VLINFRSRQQDAGETLALIERARERDLEQGLLDHIRNFFLELGVGFASAT
jgi:Protein of unknown function (DUF1016).